MFEFDLELGVCGVYSLVYADRIQFEYVKDLPAHECPAIFGFSAEDTPKVINWASDRIQEAKKKGR